jgi:hypothetical protein
MQAEHLVEAGRGASVGLWHLPSQAVEVGGSMNLSRTEADMVRLYEIVMSRIAEFHGGIEQARAAHPYRLWLTTMKGLLGLPISPTTRRKTKGA